MDMFEQMKAVVGAFETAGVGYALCGGLAVAVHAAPRATIDLDFLIAEASLETAERTVEALGRLLPGPDPDEKDAIQPPRPGGHRDAVGDDG